MTPIDILTVVSVHDLGPLWLKETLVFSMLQTKTGWWFQVFFIFTRILGESDPIWLAHIFFNWIETGQPPPSKRKGDRCAPVQMHGLGSWSPNGKSRELVLPPQKWGTQTNITKNHQPKKSMESWATNPTGGNYRFHAVFLGVTLWENSSALNQNLGG